MSPCAFEERPFGHLDQSLLVAGGTLRWDKGRQNRVYDAHFFFSVVVWCTDSLVTRLSSKFKPLVLAETAMIEGV